MILKSFGTGQTRSSLNRTSPGPEGVYRYFSKIILGDGSKMRLRHPSQSVFFFVMFALLAWNCRALASPPIDLTSAASPFSPKAKGDAVWGLTNCTVSHLGSPSQITCPAPATFSPAGSGFGTSHIIADGAGANRAVYYGTIMSVTGGGTMPLGFGVSPAPSFDVGNTPSTQVLYLKRFAVGSGGSGYKFGSTQTLVCSACMSGDGHVDATGSPGEMTVTAAAITSGGTGGTTSTSCTLTPIGQQGLAGKNLTILLGSVSGGSFALSMTAPISMGGTIIADSNTYSGGTYSDTLTGDGSPTQCIFPSGSGPVAKLTYSVTAERITPGTGTYVGSPPCASGGAATTSVPTPLTAMVLTCSAVADTYLGIVAYGTDNTAAFRAALGSLPNPAAGTMNALSASGQPVCLYLPAGNYLTEPINGVTTPPNQYMAQGYGCWLGDEHYHTNIFVEPNRAGDVFAWIDANSNSSLPLLGNTQLFQNFPNSPSTTAPPTGPNQAGSTFRNITIIGDRLSAAAVNGLAFYGKTQFAYIDNIVVDFLKGHALYAGLPDSVGAGNIEESIIQNVRFENDGQAIAGGMSTMEITTNSTSASPTNGSNNLALTNIRIFQSFGPGLWIHNGSSAISSNTRSIRMLNLKIEGSQIS